MNLLTVLAFGALALGLVLLGTVGWLDERLHREDKPRKPETGVIPEPCRSTVVRPDEA